MGKFGPVFRQLKNAGDDAGRHLDDKLPQLTRNLSDHLVSLVNRVRRNDRFDGPDSNSRTPSSSSTNDQLVPRPETLDANGDIDWSRAPEGGFTLDADGNPIKHDHVPNAGDRFDRYGDPSGRYVSPVGEDGPFSYDSRSLPYAENPNAYHQYEWAHSPGDVQSVYNQLDPAARADVDAVLDKYDLDLGDLSKVTRGEAAAIPEWGTSGGATQDLLPVSVSVLASMGMIKEVG